MKLKEVPYYKSSIVLGEELRLGQLARYDLSLLACLSHIALGCAIQHERRWCHSLIEGLIPSSAYSSHLVPPLTLRLYLDFVHDPVVTLSTTSMIYICCVQATWLHAASSLLLSRVMRHDNSWLITKIAKIGVAIAHPVISCLEGHIVLRW